MSKEQVKAFYDKVESDVALQNQLQLIERETGDQAALENAIDQIIVLAQDAGFDFTKQDFIETVSEDIVSGQVSAAEEGSSKSCWVTWAWDDCYAAWGSPPPSDPCGGGNSYVPPGYQPGDED